MKSAIWLALACLLVAGCGKSDAKTETPKPPSTANQSPDTHYETLRASLTLLEGSTDSVQSALTHAKTARDQASGEIREGLDAIVDMLDSAGATLQEAAIHLPDAKDVNRQDFKYKALRTAMLEAAQDAHMELRDAAGAARSLAETQPALGELADLIDLAVADAVETVESLGGTIPSEPETEPSA